MKIKLFFAIMLLFVGVATTFGQKAYKISVTLDNYRDVNVSPPYRECHYTIWDNSYNPPVSIWGGYAPCPKDFGIVVRPNPIGNTGTIDPKSEFGQALLKAGVKKNDLIKGMEVKIIKSVSRNTEKKDTQKKQ